MGFLHKIWICTSPISNSLHLFAYTGIWVYDPCYSLLPPQHFLLRQNPKLMFHLPHLTWISHRNLESYHFGEVENNHWDQVQVFYTESMAKELSEQFMVTSYRTRSHMFLIVSALFGSQIYIWVNDLWSGVFTIPP